MFGGRPRPVTVTWPGEHPGCPDRLLRHAVPLGDQRELAGRQARCRTGPTPDAGADRAGRTGHPPATRAGEALGPTGSGPGNPPARLHRVAARGRSVRARRGRGRLPPNARPGELADLPRCACSAGTVAGQAHSGRRGEQHRVGRAHVVRPVRHHEPGDRVRTVLSGGFGQATGEDLPGRLRPTRRTARTHPDDRRQPGGRRRRGRTGLSGGDRRTTADHRTAGRPAHRTRPTRPLAPKPLIAKAPQGALTSDHATLPRPRPPGGSPHHSTGGVPFPTYRLSSPKWVVTGQLWMDWLAVHRFGPSA